MALNRENLNVSGSLKKSLNGDISPPIDPTKANNSLLDSSHLDASNGGGFVSLASIDGEIFR